MPIQKTIVIEVDTKLYGSLTRQLRFFGDDLVREIELPKLGDLGGYETIDRATDRLEVRVFHNRQVRSVRQIVDELLKKHFLDYRSQVSYRD